MPGDAHRPDEQPAADQLPSTGGVYRTPVYKELSRKGTLSTSGHFVMRIELPSDREGLMNEGGFSDQAVWVKAGVGAVCRTHTTHLKPTHPRRYRMV